MPLWRILTQEPFCAILTTMSDRQTMNVSLPSDLDRFVRAQVEAGRYRTVSEAVREGLRMLEEAEHRRLLEKFLYEGLSSAEEALLPPDVLERAKAHIRGLVDQGLEDVRAGRVLDGPATMERLRDELRSRRPS